MLSFQKFIMAQTGRSQSKYRSCAFITVKNPIQQALLKKVFMTTQKKSENGRLEPRSETLIEKN